ncbi:hypothetical protein EAE93_13850 [Photorhabdus akhurstii]|nr:hypothetical protein [Photorhabdus akhurstii]
MSEVLLLVVKIFTHSNKPFLFPVYTRHLSSCSLLAALTHPGHIVLYAPGDSLPCRRDAS